MLWNTSLNDLICSDLGQHRASHDCWKLASKCQCPERLKKAAFPVPLPILHLVKRTVTKLSVVLPALPHPLAGPSASCPSSSCDTRTSQHRWPRNLGSQESCLNPC